MSYQQRYKVMSDIAWSLSNWVFPVEKYCFECFQGELDPGIESCYKEVVVFEVYFSQN